MNRPMVLLEGARSVVSLALSYNTGEPSDEAPRPRGKVARYAWGRDYHSLIKSRTRRFVRELPDVVGGPVRARYYVDDGPMNDRAAAERAQAWDGSARTRTSSLRLTARGCSWPRWSRTWTSGPIRL